MKCCDIILLMMIQLTSLDTRISLCIHAPFGTKTILSRSHFEDDSSTHISGSGSPIRIKPTFVLFKHVTLILINYLETQSHWDNTSCYYKWSVVNTNPGCYFFIYFSHTPTAKPQCLPMANHALKPLLWMGGKAKSSGLYYKDISDAPNCCLTFTIIIDDTK